MIKNKFPMKSSTFHLPSNTKKYKQQILGLATLLEHVNLKIFKMIPNQSFLFKNLVYQCVQVGKNGLYSAGGHPTIIIWVIYVQKNP